MPLNITIVRHIPEPSLLISAYWFLLLLLLTGYETVSERCLVEFDSRTSKSGNFSSPNWPSNYPINTRCIYNFHGQQYETLNITFFVFDLETPFAKGCLKDYIDISTITAFNVKRLIGRYCGTEVPSPLLSMHPRAEIIFKSNHVVTRRGFHGMYEFLDESIIGLPKSTLSTIKGCGGSEAGSGGVIISPNFPASFPEQVDCMWLIRVRQDQHIYLRVVELQLFGSIANCKEAQLAIYDGYENFDFDPKDPKRYCGDLRYYKGLEDKVELSASNRFKSDITASQWSEQVRSQEVVGFKLIWTAVSFTPKEKCSDFLCQNSEYCLNPRIGMTPCPETYFFCIDNSLLCDGLPNCSEQDSSDEDKCALSIVAFVSAAAGLVLIMTCCCCCVCRKRRKRARLENKVSTPRKESAGSSGLQLHCSSDASMQLRQLEHSPSFGSSGNFFPPPHTSSPPSPQTADMMNCSVHGPRVMTVQQMGNLQAAYHPSDLSTSPVNNRYFPPTNV